MMLRSYCFLLSILCVACAAESSSLGLESENKQIGSNGSFDFQCSSPGVSIDLYGFLRVDLDGQKNKIGHRMKESPLGGESRHMTIDGLCKRKFPSHTEVDLKADVGGKSFGKLVIGSNDPKGVGLIRASFSPFRNSDTVRLTSIKVYGDREGNSRIITFECNNIYNIANGISGLDGC